MPKIEDLLSTWWKLPEITLHDAAFLMVGEEPAATLSHAASEALQRLLRASRFEKRSDRELAVTECRRLGQEGPSAGVTVDPPRKRRRLLDQAQAFSVSDGRYGVQVEPMRPPGPKELVVKTDELLRWAAEVGEPIHLPRPKSERASEAQKTRRDRNRIAYLSAALGLVIGECEEIWKRTAPKKSGRSPFNSAAIAGRLDAQRERWQTTEAEDIGQEAGSELIREAVKRWNGGKSK